MKTLTIILSLCICCFTMACKKEKAATPPNYAETMKNTFWGGKYYDLANIGKERLYNIFLNADNTFDWNATNPATTFKGTWSVTGNIITFKFSSGSKNEWSGQIDGKRLINISVPVPDGFRFINCIKDPL